jgi:phosphoribosylamine--glycine ligase
MERFQLQRKVEGVEVAVSGFFNGSGFVDDVNFSLEHKKLFPGNIGPSTGEMGASMFWVGRNELFAETLGRLETWLAEEGYASSIDVNCIVNEQGILPLEFTPRFGYPTIALQAESVLSGTGELFYDLAHGNEPDVSFHQGYQVGVRIVLPSFPFDDEETYDESSRNPAIVFEGEDRAGIHIEDAKLVDGQWRVAGESGMPLVVTGMGETMQAARRECYDRVEQMIIPNLYYRNDIGERWIAGDGDRLDAWRYLRPPD